MNHYTIEQSDEEFYTSHPGISFVGLALNRLTSIPSGMAKAAPTDNVISYANAIKSYCGFLVQTRAI
jgi:hypothetical protein